MRKREAIQPRKYEKAEADTILKVAGSKNRSESETEEIPPGSIERGERTKECTYTWEVCSSLREAVRGIEVLLMERT